MYAIRPVILAALLVPMHGVSAQDVRPKAPRAHPAQAKASAYVRGKVTRTGVVRGSLYVEFGIRLSDGLRSEELLVVIRPSAANVVVDEVKVEAVNDRQALGRCMHSRLVKVGDVVVFQRTLDPDVMPSAASGDLGEMYAEITFRAPPPGETRTAFNARITRITWEGMIDMRKVEAIVYLDGRPEARMSVSAASIEQMRVNGLVLVVDPPKNTLVARAIHEFREVVRADAAQRERMEIALAKIAADADARVRIAAAQADADARVRIAAAQAEADADARVRIAADRAKSEADTRLQMAEIESRERLARERIQQEYILGRERIAANTDSNRWLNRALTAAGGLLQIGAWIAPEFGGPLNALAGGTSLLQAVMP